MLDRSSECHALSAELAVKGATLQSIVGPNFVPRLEASTDAGKLRVEVLSCESAPAFGISGTPGAIGRVFIRLDQSQLPIALSGIDWWDSYALHIAEAKDPLTRFMRAHQVATISGRASLKALEGGHGPAFAGEIDFGQGSLTIRAPTACTPAPFGQRRAIVGTNPETFSLFFGSEAGRECRLDDAELVLEGITPLSDLGFDPSASVIEYRRELSWQHKIWRRANLGLK